MEVWETSQCAFEGMLLPVDLLLWMVWAYSVESMIGRDVDFMRRFSSGLIISRQTYLMVDIDMWRRKIVESSAIYM